MTLYPAARRAALLLALFALFAAWAALAADPGVPLDDASRMEKSLQQLNWKQFRSIIEAVPKLNADVEAYGAFGWQYVQANYTSYGWKKNIDRLDDGQKQLLAELIRRAEAAR